MREKARVIRLLEDHRIKIDKLYFNLKQGNYSTIEDLFSNLLGDLLEAQEIIDRQTDIYK